MAKVTDAPSEGTLIHILKLTEIQEKALRVLSMPILAKISTLELLGYLPAIPTLPGVGAGAPVYTETRFLLEPRDHMNGDHAIYPQRAMLPGETAADTTLNVKVNWFLFFDTGVVTIKECGDGGPVVTAIVEMGGSEAGPR